MLLKAWYIDWLPVRNLQAIKKERGRSKAQRQNNVRVKDENENNDMRGIAGLTTLTFFVIFRENRPSTLSHFSNIIMKNDNTAKEHEVLPKSIGRILEIMPKSYLLEHTC